MRTSLFLLLFFSASVQAQFMYTPQSRSEDEATFGRYDYRAGDLNYRLEHKYAQNFLSEEELKVVEKFLGRDKYRQFLRGDMMTLVNKLNSFRNQLGDLFKDERKVSSYEPYQQGVRNLLKEFRKNNIDGKDLTMNYNQFQQYSETLTSIVTRIALKTKNQGYYNLFFKTLRSTKTVMLLISFETAHTRMNTFYDWALERRKELPAVYREGWIQRSRKYGELQRLFKSVEEQIVNDRFSLYHKYDPDLLYNEYYRKKYIIEFLKGFEANLIAEEERKLAAYNNQPSPLKKAAKVFNLGGEIAAGTAGYIYGGKVGAGVSAATYKFTSSYVMSAQDYSDITRFDKRRFARAFVEAMKGAGYGLGRWSAFGWGSFSNLIQRLMENHFDGKTLNPWDFFVALTWGSADAALGSLMGKLLGPQKLKITKSEENAIKKMAWSKLVARRSRPHEVFNRLAMYGNGRMTYAQLKQYLQGD